MTGLPDPPDDKIYIVTQKSLRDLKGKVAGLINLRVGPGLALTKGDNVWSIDLDILSSTNNNPSGSFVLATKEVTICENGTPVTYTFLTTSS